MYPAERTGCKIKSGSLPGKGLGSREHSHRAEVQGLALDAVVVPHPLLLRQHGLAGHEVQAHGGAGVLSCGLNEICKQTIRDESQNVACLYAQQCGLN